MNKFLFLSLPFILCGGLIAMDHGNSKSPALPYTALVAQKQNLKELGRKLRKAAERGDYAQVKSLLKQGAPVDALDDSGHSALIFAASYGRTNICKLLIAHKAEINCQGLTPLMCAAGSGYKDTVKLLVDNNAHINAKESLSNTSLIYALRNNQKSMCELLLTHKADIGAKDYFDQTPLTNAINFHLKDICMLFIDTMCNDIKREKKMIITFLGINKFRKPACQKLIGRDVMGLITTHVMTSIKQRQQSLVKDIETAHSKQFKNELRQRYQNRLGLNQHNDYQKPFLNLNYVWGCIAISVFLLLNYANTILEIGT